MKFKGHKAIRYVTQPQDEDAWWAYQCGHCGYNVTGAVVAIGDQVRWLQCTNCGFGSVLNGAAVYPGVSFGPAIEGLPGETAQAYDEARRCMSVNAYTATELICRKILMHVAVDKGAEEGKSFLEYIDYLEAQGHIAPGMKDWVDLIRRHGNLSTHSLERPDRARAESSLLFTAELLRIVYEMEHKSKPYLGT